MAENYFLDNLHPFFSALNWNRGFLFLHNNCVKDFQGYETLISSKIKVPTGETYDVRFKLNDRKNHVQWMECSCHENRKAGEKCAHLAAFALYIDETGHKKLKLSMTFQRSHLLMEKLKEEKSKSALKPQNLIQKNKRDPISTKAQISKKSSRTNSLPVFRTTNITQIDVSETIPHLDMKTRAGAKEFVYQIDIDDACRILIDPNYHKFFSKKLKSLFHASRFAKRFFRVSRTGTHSLVIQKRLHIYEEVDIIKDDIPIKELPKNYVGHKGFFHEKFGYLVFQDGLTELQIIQWENMPHENQLEDDAAAYYIETQFEKLKSIASVDIDPLLLKTNIFQDISVSQIEITTHENSPYYFLHGNLSQDLQKKEERPTILEVLLTRSQNKKYLKSKDGFTKVSDKFDWLIPAIQTDQSIRMTKLDLIKFQSLLAEFPEIQTNSDTVQKLQEGLVSREKLPSPDLNQSQLKLRPYQTEGLSWLWWLYHNQLGGLLADDMGLGKTHQAMGLIAAIQSHQQACRILVVCPTTVIDHWVDKLSENLNRIPILNYRSSKRHLLWNGLNPAIVTQFVIVTSYGVLLRDAPILGQIPWELVILDEAHIVKNQSTRTYKAANRLTSRMKLCLTGTPLENNLLELKSLYDFIAPNYLGTDSVFKKKYLTGEDKENNALKSLELQRLLHPFKMRRKKSQVLFDLPTKVEDIRHCHLNAQQKKIYNEILSLKGSEIVKSLATETESIPYIHIFSIITLLKQVCDDPALINLKYEGSGSGKLDAFDELLQEALNSQFKVVVFSQYAKMIERLSQHLQKKKIQHVSLTGQSTNRGAIIKKFQEDPQTQVFLGSLLAGGAGIDLTAANVVIHYDRWWNAAKENQATDRVHRIGQIKNVQVYKLVTKNTLEEKIDRIIMRKKALFEQFVEKDEDIFKKLTREELLELFAEVKEQI